MNNAVFGRTLENVRKHRNINLEARNKRKSYLVLEPNYIEQNDSQKSENLLAIEMKKIKLKNE